MPQRLPTVLTSTDLPVAELHAARLDGELATIDGLFTSIDEIDGPRLRARALGSHPQARKLIAEQLSAAWVWGATALPPHRHQLCVAIGSRVAHSSVSWMILREVVIEPDEVVSLDGLQLTSPTRTVVDLARFSQQFGSRERDIVSWLAEAHRLDLEAVIDSIESRRNLPRKRRAVQRLAGCITPS